MSSAPLPPMTQAATSFRRFFGELREVFYERDALFTQIELALLCKEHVLVTGPPGTAKSAIAAAVLGRIVDDATNKPSLFSKQIAENTVQADLIGPVDFKVLTETGRTEHLTDEGMLGATHAFLDEVFDGRDMLLRSILNVLHERELKHGHRVTAGKCECCIMTTNRYLSEVLQRSPETLLAFADRISFVCFTPKAFARPGSRADMLARAVHGQRPRLSSRLTLRELDALQDTTARVEVPGAMAEALELLATTLEQRLLAQVSRMPDYVPTKYFSHRSMVKALWTLKAAVVRDRVLHRPDRPLVAEPRDFDGLRYFFLLGGPSGADLDGLIKTAADPRERAQLEIIRAEQAAFAACLEELGKKVTGGDARELAESNIGADMSAAEALTNAWDAAAASRLAQTLRKKLVPGPRYPRTRQSLAQISSRLVAATEQALSAPVPDAPDAWFANVSATHAVIELLRSVPELQSQRGRLENGALAYGRSLLSFIPSAAEAIEYDTQTDFKAIASTAGHAGEALTRVAEMFDTLSEGVAGAAVAKERVAVARATTAEALKTAAARLVKRRAVRSVAEADVLGASLQAVEDALVALDPAMRGLKTALLTPSAAGIAVSTLTAMDVRRVADVVETLKALVDGFARHGVSLSGAWDGVAPKIVAQLMPLLDAAARRADIGVPSAADAQSGRAYQAYKTAVKGQGIDGEWTSLANLDAMLHPAGTAPNAVVPAELREKARLTELLGLKARVAYLTEWLNLLLKSLPPNESLDARRAETAFEQLLRSRFPALTVREGEFLRLVEAADALSAEHGAAGVQAGALASAVRTLSETFAAYSRRVLDVRAGR